jgi:replication-associated recombination protein RarA
MIDLYIGLRVNQFAILCGPPITGKSTIWNVVAKTINSTILNSSNNKDSVRKSIKI